MVVERENLYDERGLPKKPLRLSKLPFLMRKRAIDYMSFGERIRLAVVSEDMENYVKESKVDKSVSWSMKIHGSASSIVLNEGKVEVAVTDDFPGGETEEDKIPKREIAKWCDDKKKPTENAEIVLNKLQEILTCSVAPPRLSLDLNVAEQRIFEILSDPVYKDVDGLIVRNYRLQNKTIDAILEFCEFKTMILLPNVMFPNDYFHEKALKCKQIIYNNAKWMRVTQLLTLRDVTFVYLPNTSLEWEDIDFLVKFWITIEYDMCIQILINVRESVERMPVFPKVGALNVVGFDEVAAMFTRYAEEKFYLIISKSKNPDKKRQIGVIQVTDYVFHMKVKPVEEFKELIDILNLVQMKNEKEIALENVGIDAQLGNLDEDETEENMRRLRAEKQELKQRLMNLNVHFDGKQARLVREPAPIIE